jgi:hypothetical protein
MDIKIGDKIVASAPNGERIRGTVKTVNPAGNVHIDTGGGRIRLVFKDNIIQVNRKAV